MKKLRADKFDMPADVDSIMKIQEQAQKYRGEYPVTNIREANILLGLYAQISFDEGYRECIKHTKDDVE